MNYFESLFLSVLMAFVLLLSGSCATSQPASATVA